IAVAGMQAYAAPGDPDVVYAAREPARPDRDPLAGVAHLIGRRADLPAVHAHVHGPAEGAVQEEVVAPSGRDRLLALSPPCSRGEDASPRRREPAADRGVAAVHLHIARGRGHVGDLRAAADL